MVLVGLLLVALVCLVLGLVLASVGWLIASLVVTALAASVMWTKRTELATPAAALQPAPEVADDCTAVPAEHQQRRAAADAGDAADGDVWVVDGRPRYHLSDCLIIKGQGAEPIPYPQATEDGFMPCSLCEPNAVSR